MLEPGFEPQQHFAGSGMLVYDGVCCGGNKRFAPGPSFSNVFPDGGTQCKGIH